MINNNNYYCYVLLNIKIITNMTFITVHIYIYMLHVNYFIVSLLFLMKIGLYTNYSTLMHT